MSAVIVVDDIFAYILVTKLSCANYFYVFVDSTIWKLSMQSRFLKVTQLFLGPTPQITK